jgi:hypothetical protein
MSPVWLTRDFEATGAIDYLMLELYSLVSHPYILGFQYVDTTVSENGLTKHDTTKMIARRAKHLLAL